MKRIISLILCIICALALVACGKKADPIALPQTGEITSIDITIGENTVNHSKQAWIGKLIADISGAEPTEKKSVQDAPRVENYIKIDMQLKTDVNTLFAYEENGKYYIEQPYQGIYKIDKKLFESLQESD